MDMKKVLLPSLILILILGSFIVNAQSINWSEVQPAGNITYDWGSSALSSNGNIIIVGSLDGRLFLSTDKGSSWTETRPAGDLNKDWYKLAMSEDGSKIFASSLFRLYLSTNTGASWTEVYPAGIADKEWHSVSISKNGTTLLAGTYNGRLYLSTNSGVNWNETQPVGNQDRAWLTNSINSDGSILLAGLGLGRLYKSTNQGVIWTETQPIGNYDGIYRISSMSSDGSKIIVCNEDEGKLYISTNGGTSWTYTAPTGSNVHRDWYAVSMSADGNSIIAAIDNSTHGEGALYITTNCGTTWAQTYPPGGTVQAEYWRAASISPDGTTAVAGIYGGRLYISVDPLPVELGYFKVTLSLSKGVLLSWESKTEINNYGYEIERKIDFVDTWNKIGFVEGSGNSNSPKEYSFIDLELLGRGTFCYRLKQIDNDGTVNYSKEVMVEVDYLPQNFDLSQNYPNPFNPVTTISYQIPENNHVTLRVFDMIGNEVQTLVNEEKPAGYHTITFDAENISTGVYFYQLKVGNFVSTKKLILMK